MTPQQILDQAHVLGLVAKTVMGEYDQLRRQIRDGLLLAVAGRVERVSQDTYRVNGHNVFIVGVPARWHCNCEQGQNYGPVMGDFLGHPGRVCKHIAAVGLIQTSAVTDPPLLPRPASLFELVQRLWQLPRDDVLFYDSDDVELPLNLVKKIYITNLGVGYGLKCGRVEIGIETKADYDRFFAEMQRRGVAPQAPPVSMEVQP